MSGNDHEILAAAGRALGGLELSCRMSVGELPLPPLAALLGFRVVVGEDRIVFGADPRTAPRPAW